MVLIKELSDRTGVPRKTIRYYEQSGLLPRAKRAENRYRVYDDADIDRLRFVKSARALDFTLQEIAQILATRDRNEPPCTHVMGLLQDHMDDIAARIRDLEQLHQELSALYETGKHLPEDVQMRACVCHLIQVGVGRNEPNGTTTN
ncbi:MAG: MerR family transcriptional regulator [Anaerolineaceae bacterium]|nr:MerR family transcriptional regulator [Anaerolineaceae bacterium]